MSTEHWRVESKIPGSFTVGKYWLTDDFLYFETTGFRTDSQQIPTRNIVDVDMSQSLIQRGRDVATITVHVVRGDGSRETVELTNVPDYRAGVEAINRVCGEARARHLRQQNTQHFAAPAVAAAPVNAEREALVGQLKMAGRMHADGQITDEVFIQQVHEVLPKL